MKRILMMAAVAMMTAIVLNSCVENDNPVVEPSAVDNGAWTVPDSDMDPTVSAGDDFFMHCNGSWWKATDLGDKQVTGFLRGTVLDALNEKIATLDRPSLSVLKRHATTFTFGEGEDAKALDELLRPLMEATTLEEAWLETGRMIARGGSFGFAPQAVSIDGKFYYTFSVDMALIPSLNSYDDSWLDNDPLADPDRLARLVPITGSTTRSVESSGEWPMLVAWFQGLGIDPALGLTEKEINISTTGEASSGFISQSLSELQGLGLEDYKQGIISSTCDFMESYFFPGEKSDLANNIYSKYALYESSYEFTEKYVTDAMRERTLGICHRLRESFATRINRSPWLEEGSKAAALDKLYNMSFNVGGPKTWFAEGFADLSDSESLTEDVLLLRQAIMNIHRMLAGQNVSDNVFTLLAGTFTSLAVLNSCYMPRFNAMFIYPAFMMEPLMPDNANEAFIYAASSAIGHEITHGFDATGYKFNRYGTYGPIFTSEDDNADFAALTKQLTDWYNTLEVMPDELPGLCNKGEWTLGENIADLGGFEIAYEAYTNKLKEDGFKGNELRLQQQRYYRAYAHIWKAKYTAEYAKTRTIGTNEYALGADVHSLEKERVNGVVPNTDAWYDLFDIQPNQKFYRPAQERVHIW